MTFIVMLMKETPIFSCSRYI